MKHAPDYDLLIAGAGLTGLSLALFLRHTPLRIGIMDKITRKDLRSAAYDGRTTAIALGAKQIFTEAGLWDDMAHNASGASVAAAIEEIRIADNHSPHFLHFDHYEVSDEPMGWVIENRHLRQVMLEALQASPSIDFLEAHNVESIENQPDRQIIQTSKGPVSSRLLVAADGRFSRCRNMMQIKTRTHDYKQVALTFSIKHSHSHGHIALEHFMHNGPFAVLPMHVDGSPHYSSVIWTIEPERAETLKQMDESHFIAALMEQLTDYLGEVSLHTPVVAYPLGLVVAKQAYKSRFALLGDSLHGLHPIAGQGFNLHVYDAFNLADAILSQAQLGLDIGTQITLDAFAEKSRLKDVSMILATHGFNALFSNNNPLVTRGRQLGLSAINRLPAIRHFFVKQAMGI